MDIFPYAGAFSPLAWGYLWVSKYNCSLYQSQTDRESERSQFLHLFLHARSLLSASVRLNTIGPYAAQQLLLHTVKPLVETEAERCQHLHTELARDDSSSLRDEVTHGPAVTWPLGEILAARHDLQHSRIFNS